MNDDSDASALPRLLEEGWSYHDKESERLARQLEAAAGSHIGPEQLAPFIHLSTHTIGEHLGDWARALQLGKRVLDGRTASAETARSWGRLQVAAVLAGDCIEAAHLELAYLAAPGNDFGAALLDMRFLLIDALVSNQRVAEAARIYRAGVALIEQIQTPDFLDRTIAAVSNNLGWELYETAARPSELDLPMRLCADTALAFWRKCGNWIHEARALYFRALVANALGDPASALADADKALAVIDANGQRPLDAALLHLARASALASLGDRGGKSRAIVDADAAASKLTAPDLQARFVSERIKVIAAA